MTVTVTDLFCGGGGSSLGAQSAGANAVTPPVMTWIVGRIIQAMETQ